MIKGYCAVGLSLLLLLGCSKGAAPKPLAADQVEPALQDAFKEAPPEVKTAASEVVTALGSKDDSKAFVELNDLCARTDLTPEQRSIAGRALSTVGQQLRSAAEQGNQQEEQLLQLYRARK